MKTFLLFLVVLSCAACVLCGNPQDLEAILLKFPKHWDDFAEICELVGVKVDPEDMEPLQKVWGTIVHLATSKFSSYFANRH